MEKLVVIDGNSILNRAFYGIMGSKMLQTADGTYTNAVYGFLTILFKLIEDVNPNYLAVAFDLKAPTKRHLMYSEYKGTRKGMPEELAAQMPIIKDVLKAMNITVITKEGYEADDILGTLSKFGEEQNLEVTLLTGDRDSFQLASSKTTIRIPRTKAGKTETENYDEAKIKEEYGLNPKQLIEVKGLQGDTSDNIPGVPGVGEKTALNLIQKYESIDKIYSLLEKNELDVKGKLKENLENNKELAMLSKELGTIDRDAPIEKNLDNLKVKEWNKKEVFELFKKLRFQRFIDRFRLDSINEGEGKIENIEKFKTETLDSNDKKIEEILENINKNKVFYFYVKMIDDNQQELIIKKKIESITVYNKENETAYKFNDYKIFSKTFEDEEILKCGYNLKDIYIVLKQNGIEPHNFMFDIKVAGYVLNPSIGGYKLEDLALNYIGFSIADYLNGSKAEEPSQINLFDENNEDENNEKEDNSDFAYAYAIGNLYDSMRKELEKNEELELFNKIEMPVLEVLAEMQYEGIYIDKEELLNFGNTLKNDIELLTKDIYNLVGKEFNINSPKQLGEILFEQLGLTSSKKTKNGYSTDVDALEKIKDEHPVVEKILEYRKLMKLNSTYVEGMLPFINSNTKRIHAKFHQTVTATGRISSSDPNLQNIPTRTDLGKELRKVFKAQEGYVFVDADYSQIELRVLAHMANDQIMIEAFNNDEDIHTWAASQVFGVPMNEVTKELRSKAKAVNFGIVYGISDFGLAGQLGISRKEAKKDIEKYLEKYYGIKEYMDNVIKSATEKGYSETLFGRKREIKELKSNNYMVRQFGSRAAMNTPIQGTAADIMKIAMINVYKELKTRNLKSKLILQVHDELLIETKIEELEEVKDILKSCMESACSLNVPLKAELAEGFDWYSAK